MNTPISGETVQETILRSELAISKMSLDMMSVNIQTAIMLLSIVTMHSSLVDTDRMLVQHAIDTLVTSTGTWNPTFKERFPEGDTK